MPCALAPRARRAIERLHIRAPGEAAAHLPQNTGDIEQDASVAVMLNGRQHLLGLHTVFVGYPARLAIVPDP